MVQFAAQYPWLIPLIPLLTCRLIGLFGFKLKGLSHIPAIIAIGCSFLLSISLLIGLSNGSLKAESLHDLRVFDWFTAGNFHIAAAVTIDQLTALYLSFITGIGLLIFIYAAGYMQGDYGYFRFFAYMSIFVFFMTTLVMGNNFVLLFLGWEGVGLASYLLIGYYYPRPSAVAAAKKAFITNRVGDLGLLIGIFLLYRYFGTLEFSAIFAQLHDSQKIANLMPIIRYIPFCIMLGAFGKSAQFPLHVWLPDAMEGPTPVSALIHAATMVTAGIYLIARTMPLFAMGPGNYFDVSFLGHVSALDVVACIGCFTAFLAASIALCQYDLKRIWAYSTLSQLGYMFLGLGVMASTSAVFHVFTHAFFKALLFLSAGSVMHAMGGELDIRKMSGLRKVMPITAFTMLIGCIALAGVPGFAGFFSKDEIIAHAVNAPSGPGFFLGLVALLVAFMTAFYTFRVYFKVFLGPLQLPTTAGHHEESPFLLDTGPEIPHEGVDTVHAKQGHEEASHGKDSAGVVHPATEHHDEEAHGPDDGSPLMWVPLLILCIGAVGAGYLGFSKTGDWLHPFLGAALVEAPEAAERVSEHFLLALGFLLPFAGIAVAYYFYKANRPAADAMAARFRPLVNFLYNKWYWDEIYSAFILKPIWMLALVFSIFDRYIIDGVVFFIAFIPQIIGYSLKPTQRGVLQRYAVGMIAGLAAIILGVMYLLYT